MDHKPKSRESAELDFDNPAGVLRSKSTQELRAARFVLGTIQSPWLMRTGRLFARLGLALRIPGTETALERTVFKQFCGGTNLQEALLRADELQRSGIGSILDYARETSDDESELDEICEEISRVVAMTTQYPHIPFVAIKLSGLGRTALLERMSQGEELNDNEVAEAGRIEARLVRLADEAVAARSALFVDAEHSWIQPAIDRLVEKLMEKYNRERTVVLTTVQMYLSTGSEDLRRGIERARSGGYRMGVKLVRGAYMEQEAEHARARGKDSPIQPNKQATDQAYDAALSLCLENLDIVTVCVATHNVASIRHLVSEMARLGIARDDSRITASQLLGMFDRVTYPLADAGYNALKYVPYGGVREALPYLLRRADENKSVADQLVSELSAVREELKRRSAEKP